MNKNLIKVKELLSKSPKASALLKQLFSEEKIEMKAEVKTADGAVLYTPGDSFAQGVEVYTMDAEGNPVLAAAGEYILEDGSTLVIADGGIVAEIKAKEQEEEMSAEVQEVITKMAEQIETLTTENETLKSQLSADNTKLSSEVTKLKAEIAKLKSTPAAKDVKLEKEKKQENKNPKPFAAKSMTERVLENIKHN